MRILTIILIIVFSSCQSPKKESDFTFYKGNIHESYYLKFNSSDTLYFINAYPYEEQTSFTILSSEEKEKIQNILDSITFPKEEKFTNSLIEDGETNAFYLKDKKLTKKLMIHGHMGPKHFLSFGESLVKIKNLHKFTRTNKKFDLSIFNKILNAPPPPIIN
ncbi:hypothetical protein SAMN05444143_1182 [Flavobacterium succinicans]|uniref:Uncharacterized protein n=1 Tax=Flavobacterium succinicans TaxID=29536 RepID=A0A1I4ZTS0_9FLAO|nr:hypothetical protein [Flavobacterium succinicans]SFN53634.1 hypothetical protein SAMN05444143_1182 [Flavobacterium succinicans]